MPPLFEIIKGIVYNTMYSIVVLYKKVTHTLDGESDFFYSF
jgi:hypothetical protein